MSTPFSELLRRRREREPMDERLPDGRSVYDLINQQGAQQQPVIPSADPNPVTGTLNEDARQQITRPRTVGQQPNFRDMLDRSATRDRRTQPRDYVADDAAALRESLNRPRSWRDRIVDVTDAMNAVAGGPRRVLPTKREREIQRFENSLGTSIEQQKQSMNQMVDVQLENGEVVRVPARTAASLRSRQQEIGLRGQEAERKRQLDAARIANWNAMDEVRRRRIVADMYKSGGLNTPELLQYAADQLGIPGRLQEKFISGQMRDAIDDEGNLIQINRQTQEVLPTGKKGYAVTQEAGRDRRAAATQAGADRRAGMRGAGQGAAPDRVTMRKAAELIGQIERARSEMEAADRTGKAKDKEAARLIGEQAATELNALGAGYEAGRGEGGYPYYKKQRGGAVSAPAASGAYSGRRIAASNLPEAAKRLGMTVEQARKHLEEQGATIY